MSNRQLFNNLNNFNSNCNLNCDSECDSHCDCDNCSKNKHKSKHHHKCCKCSKCCKSCKCCNKKDYNKKIFNMNYSSGPTGLNFNPSNTFGSMGFGQASTNSTAVPLAEAYNFIVPFNGNIRELFVSASTTSINVPISVTYTIYKSAIPSPLSTTITPVNCHPNNPNQLTNLLSQFIAINTPYPQFIPISSPVTLTINTSNSSYFNFATTSISVTAGDRIALILTISNPVNNPIINSSAGLTIMNC